MDSNYKELGYAVALQACKDYFRSAEAKKKQIIKDLKSAWMDWWTGGLSVKLAEKLISEPETIRKRILKISEEEIINESN